MLIDWFTVAAQVVNFVVLVWLMKRFLYQPILRAVEAREKRIADSLADAAAQQSEARREREAFQAKNEALERERAALLAQATEEAKAERQRLLEEARRSALAQGSRLREALQTDANDLCQALAEKAQREVFLIAQKVLADLAGDGFDSRAAEVFIRRLTDAEDAQRQRLFLALQSERAPVVVRSAFDLSVAARERINVALRRLASPSAEIRFETAPALIGGIELSSGGHKVAWSIADYLASLEQAARETLNRPSPEPPLQDER